jgi:mRNA-degrading endonuclease RelE of RelBE toxin-antitoxin system
MASLHKANKAMPNRHFPYGIVYEIQKDEIVIIAIANLHREPDYWME